MALHNQTGKEGELLAIEYLRKNGYDILQQNWRYRHWELDIVAFKNEKIHIVEVKTRKTAIVNLPEQLVSKSKIRLLIDAGNEFMNLHPQYARIQFDVLGIIIQADEITYLLIEDVYLW